MAACLARLNNPKFLVENVHMVSEGDDAFEEELKEVWTTEVAEDLQQLEEALRDGSNQQATVRLLVCKVVDSGCVMGAEGVRRVAGQMMMLAAEERYAEVAALISVARREFIEFNLLWDIYKHTWRRTQRRKNSIFY